MRRLSLYPQELIKFLPGLILLIFLGSFQAARANHKEWLSSAKGSQMTSGLKEAASKTDGNSLHQDKENGKPYYNSGLCIILVFFYLAVVRLLVISKELRTPLLQEIQITTENESAPDLKYPNLNELDQKLNQLIAEGEVEYALDELQKIMDLFPDENIKNKLLHLSAIYSDNESMVNMNLISYEDYSIERSKAIRGLILLIDEYCGN